MVKGLQNFFRFMKHTYSDNPDLKSKYGGLQDSFSEFRSIIKFFKWLGSYRDCKEILAQKEISSMDCVSFVATVADAGYKFGKRSACFIRRFITCCLYPAFL